MYTFALTTIAIGLTLGLIGAGADQYIKWQLRKLRREERRNGSR